MKKKSHSISPKHLSLKELYPFSRKGNTLKLSDTSVQAIETCSSFLANCLNDENRAFYGINTGFGSLCNTVISKDDLEQLQLNLVRSHACGTGNTVPKEVVRLMLFLKIQSLSYGNSGVQLSTVQRLIDFYNLDLLPVIYEQGSLGASGDLAPLAHLSLPLLGLGEFWDGNEIRPAHELLKKHHLEPLRFVAKEGLALLNGTQFMSAYAVYISGKAKKLSLWADVLAALSAEAFDCRIDPFGPLSHNIRKQIGQRKTAKRICKILEGSEIMNAEKVAVQDPYSFRCVPQVHGASKDTFKHFNKIIEREVNSVTDNPNIFPKEGVILSAGNFHGQPLALVLDFVAIALSELGNISERRTYQLISGLRGLPPYLCPKPGLNSGMMIPQYTAASIASQNKQLCSPASVDSIVSSNGQEDHVSMGANAATKALRVLDNVQRILAIELLNAAQAIEFRRPKKSSKYLESLLTAYRSIVPFMEEDRTLYLDIQKSVEFIEKHPIEKP